MKINDKVHIFIKNTTYLIVPIAISILGIMLPSSKENGVMFGMIWAIIIVLFIVIVISIVIFTKRELKEAEDMLALKDKVLEVNALNKKIDILSYINATYNELIEGYANSVNRVAKDIKEKGEIDLREFNVNELCEIICRSCCILLKKVVGIDNNSNSINVGFILSYINENGESTINMIAHSNSGPLKPRVYRTPEPLDKCIYHYAELIRDNNSDIEIISDHKILSGTLKKRNATTDLEKYDQYVAIPVMCAENKLVGILQIVTKKGIKLGNNEEDINYVVENYINSYVPLLLLVHKIKKGLIAIPPPTLDTLMVQRGVNIPESAKEMKA